MTPFGTLTKKKDSKYNIKHIVNKDSMELDYLFSNIHGQLEKMTVISAERQIALDNLRMLTQELQSKHLNYNSNEKLSYFTK